MKKLSAVITIGIFLLMGSFPVFAGDDIQLPKGLKGVSIGGQWFLSYSSGKTANVSYNSFKINRAYINIKKSFTSWFGARITPDAHQISDGSFMVRLKYAYANFNLPTFGFFYKPHVEWGLAHRTWLDFEENLNYYRLQGTMFLERNGLFNSADMGVGFFTLLGGEMDEDYRKNVNSKYPGKYGSIAFGIYNGGGYHGKELNTQKEPEVRVTIRPLPDVLPGLQFSYLGVFAHGNTATAPDWNINTGFISFEHERVVLTGTIYSGKGNMKGEVDAQGIPKDKSGYSVFGELKLPEQKISLIGRYDQFDFNTNVEHDERTRLILGLAIHLTGHNKILIDYDVASYAQEGKDSDPRFQVTTEVHF